MFANERMELYVSCSKNGAVTTVQVSHDLQNVSVETIRRDFWRLKRQAVKEGTRRRGSGSGVEECRLPTGWK